MAPLGWNEALYKTWYLVGAIYAAGWLGLGTIYLLRQTRFGYAFALALVLAGLFTVLTQARFQYANTGLAPLIYLGVAIALAIDVVALTYLKSPRWADVTAVVVVGGSAVAAILMLFAQVPAPGYFLDARGIPVADGLPGYIRLLSPFFNVAGALSLILGAAYSAYVYMPKTRVIRFTVSASQSGPAFLANMLVAIVAVPINFVASLPQAMADLFRGRMNSRVPAMILIALGATIEAVSNGLSRFGDTSAVFLRRVPGHRFPVPGLPRVDRGDAHHPRAIHALRPAQATRRDLNTAAGGHTQKRRAASRAASVR